MLRSIRNKLLKNGRCSFKKVKFTSTNGCTAKRTAAITTVLFIQQKGQVC